MEESGIVPARLRGVGIGSMGWSRLLQTILGSNALLLLLLAAFFAIGLGSYPLQVPDEARYSEIPREMVATGDYVTPRLNGVKYFEKPVLFYWLQASSIKLFGFNEWSLRMWTALLALVGCVLTYQLARRLYDRPTGLASTVVLASSLLYFLMGHTITLDMAVSVFVTGMLASFLLAIRSPLPSKQRFAWSMGCYAFAAAAVLTKGLMGLLVPGAVMFLWLCLTWQWGVLRHIYFWPGTLLFFALTLPWHVLVQLKTPEFFQFYIIEQQFLRYLTDYASRYKPFWFFIPITLIGLFPWTVFLPQALRKAWQERKAEPAVLFLLVWAGFIFLFFSLSKSKLVPYILPIFPALAILIGHYLVQTLRRAAKLNASIYAYLLCCVGLLVALWFAPMYVEPIDPEFSQRFFKIMLCCVLASALSVLTFTIKQQTVKAIASMGVGAAVCLLVFMVSWSHLYDKTLKPVIADVMPQVRTYDVIVSYDAYFQDLPVYTERIITVVNPRGEIRWGSTLEDTSAWIVTFEDFWQRWQGEQRFIVFAHARDEAAIRSQGHTIYIVYKTPRYIVFTNKE